MADRNYIVDARVKLGGLAAAVEKTGASVFTWLRWERQRRIANNGTVALVATLTGIPRHRLGKSRQGRFARPPADPPQAASA